MKRRFYLAIVFFLACFAASEAALFAFSPAYAADRASHEFKVHSNVLLPVNSYLYLGDHLPTCTDAKANMFAYRRERLIPLHPLRSASCR